MDHVCVTPFILSVIDTTSISIIGNVRHGSSESIAASVSGLSPSRFSAREIARLSSPHYHFPTSPHPTLPSTQPVHRLAVLTSSLHPLKLPRRFHITHHDPGDHLPTIPSTHNSMPIATPSTPPISLRQPSASPDKKCPPPRSMTTPPPQQ